MIVACLEEVAFNMGFIDAAQVRDAAEIGYGLLVPSLPVKVAAHNRITAPVAGLQLDHTQHQHLGVVRPVQLQQRLRQALQRFDGP